MDTFSVKDKTLSSSLYADTHLKYPCKQILYACTHSSERKKTCINLNMWETVITAWPQSPVAPVVGKNGTTWGTSLQKQMMYLWWSSSVHHESLSWSPLVHCVMFLQRKRPECTPRTFHLAALSPCSRRYLPQWNLQWRLEMLQFLLFKLTLSYLVKVQSFFSVLWKRHAYTGFDITMVF